MCFDNYGNSISGFQLNNLIELQQRNANGYSNFQITTVLNLRAKDVAKKTITTFLFFSLTYLLKL